MAISKRISFLKIPLDIVDESSLEEIIRDLIGNGGQHQIMLLSFRDLMRARRNREYRALVESASLVIPTSKSILAGTSFLNLEKPIRWMPFEFLIRVLGILETNRKSVYLLGARPSSINTAASNLRASFPGLNIVGRCSGFYKKDMEKDLLLAIRKAGPSLLLVGNGVRGRDKWIHAHLPDFSDGLFLWEKDCFDIFAGKKKRISKETWTKGLEGLPGLVSHPWRIFRGLQYLYYYLLLLIYRIRR